MPSEPVTRQWIVNGAPRLVTFAASSRLLDVVRDELGLSGTKEGCGEGECGACSVVVDDLLKLSCLQLAAAVPDGARITTVEGVGRTASGERLQQVMVERGGVQCGFCTPGFVVAAWWYVEQRPPVDAREALAGNLCRCTGYQGLVAAVADVAEEMAPGARGGGR
jgi:carbon-monoxide dehydrogenase small subunit